MLRTLTVCTLLLSSCLSAQQADKKHLLFLGGSIDYAHDSVSHAMYTIAKIGQESGLFDVRFHTDIEPLTKRKLGANKKNLDYFDAVFFYTQGDLPLDAEQKAALISFVRDDGKGFLAAHSGTDSFRATWPDYAARARLGSGHAALRSYRLRVGALGRALRGPAREEDEGFRRRVRGRDPGRRRPV